MIALDLDLRAYHFLNNGFLNVVMNMYRQMGLTAVGLCMAAGVWAAQPVVLVEVGGIKITDQDVRAELAQAPEAMAQRTLENQTALTELAKNLASRRLLMQEAQKNGLAAKPEVKAQLKLNEERFLSEVRLEQYDESHMPSAKAVDDYARAQFKANPKAFEAPADARVRHILIEGDTPAAKTKIDKLAAELKGGADFEKLAKENSEDKGNAPKGGDLGFAPAGRFVPEFEKAMAALTKSGEISAPVKTQFGWHLIQLVERRPARTLAYEEVADQLRGEAARRLLMRTRMEYAQGLIKDAKVNDAAIKSITVTPAPIPLTAPAPAKK
ncbi:peptidylprolyl isomerase [Diaphorobacter sp. HDW4B]|uniref:peptidylprolyl isomerase n=1 Tax=Diaphorobacter sp. HDW4B TaxID=2714925 RepID=UPI00140ADF5B|nr:peptidylprolyl isomerase [Diaphorobacter sp. HDW4B]QIL70222.1 peptidylprolyl isomerase [Diaphorobacter sp. HDW4B]